MSINFREMQFDVATKRQIIAIYRRLRAKDRISDINKMIMDVLPLLENYYNKFRKQDYQTEKERNARAAEVFSQFLQHLVYYSCHNVKNSKQELDKAYVQDFIGGLIQGFPNYFHTLSFLDPRSPRIITWTDPKEGYTAVMSAVRNDLLKNVSNIIQDLDIACGGRDKPAFKNYFFQKSKYGHTLFNVASEVSSDVFKLLLRITTDAFGAQSSELLKLMSESNTNGFTPLISACARPSKSFKYASERELNREMTSSQEIVGMLLSAAEVASNGPETRRFRDFIEAATANGETALHAACRAGNYINVQLLLSYAKKAYGKKDSPGFRDFISRQNKMGLSPIQLVPPNTPIFDLLAKYKSKLYFNDDRHQTLTSEQDENESKMDERSDYVWYVSDAHDDLDAEYLASPGEPVEAWYEEDTELDSPEEPEDEPVVKYVFETRKRARQMSDAKNDENFPPPSENAPQHPSEKRRYSVVKKSPNSSSSQSKPNLFNPQSESQNKPADKASARTSSGLTVVKRK